MISALNTTTNYQGNGLHIGNARLGPDDFRRALLKFDVSSIPAGAIIGAATLTLFGDYSAVGADYDPRTFYCYRCTRAWVEGQATWIIYSTGNDWATAGLGAGTDYVTTGGDTTSQTLLDPRLEFDGLAALVQDALDNRSGILNVVIIGPEVAGVRFYADMGDSDTGNADERPMLVVGYDKLDVESSDASAYTLNATDASAYALAASDETIYDVTATDATR